MLMFTCPVDATSSTVHHIIETALLAQSVLPALFVVSGLVKSSWTDRVDKGCCAQHLRLMTQSWWWPRSFSIHSLKVRGTGQC